MEGPRTTDPSTPPEGDHGKTPRKAAVASFMGSAVEYYDFFIFGSAAALIFPHVFFPDDDASALVMSFATFGFAYVARPSGQPETTFPLVKASATELVFENPTHDFPQRILYRKASDGTVSAAVAATSSATSG